MPAYVPRLARIMSAQLLVTEALRSLEMRAGTAHRTPPQPPAGMKWLVTPREALTARHEDATTVRIAFARYLFWRLLLGARRPTHASARQALRQLTGRFLWHLALRQHAAGKPLPLASEKNPRDVPAYALSAHPERFLAPTETRQENRQDGTDATDNPNIPDAWEWWVTWGDAATLPAADLVDLSQLLGPDDYAAAAADLTLQDAITSFYESGFSDMDIAGLIDWAWNGQASLWAGQAVYEDAGIQGGFDLLDPMFYDYLRYTSGYLITQIDDGTRADIADDLWALSGGAGALDGTPGLSWTAIADKLNDYWWAALDGTTQFSADYRAYLIASTETSRAENFGTFVSLWTLGAQQKIWIVQAGACQICVGNAEAGGIPLTESFPGRVQSPPQHPLCKCGVAAFVPDSFSPDDWTPRDPGVFADSIFDTDAGLWPAVDLGEFADIDVGDFGLARQPAVTRARGERPPRRHPGVDYATATRMADLAMTEALTWAHAAHVRVPETEPDLLVLVKRLRMGHDELPDRREADEGYIHRLREGLAAILKQSERA